MNRKAMRVILWAAAGLGALLPASSALAQAPPEDDLEVREFDELLLKDQPGKVWKGEFRRDEKGNFDKTPKGLFLFDIQDGPQKGMKLFVQPANLESYRLKQSEEQVWRKKTKNLGNARSDVPKYLQWAEKCLEKGFDDLAEELLRKANRLDPKDVDLYLRLGGLLRKRFKFDDELALYDAAGKAGVPRPEKVLASQAGLLALLGLAAEAEERYRQALAEDSKYVPALLGLGKLHLSARRFQEADARLTAAADKAVGQDEKAEALRWASEAKLKAGDLAGAKKAAEDAAFLLPDDKDLKLRLGSIYAWGGEWARAKEKFMEVLDLTPEDLSSTGPGPGGAAPPPGPAAPPEDPAKEPAAEPPKEDVWGPAEVRDPLKSKAYADLALCLVRESAIEKAESYLKLAAGLDPASPFPWVVLGSLREKQERWLDAKAAYEKALQVHPPDAFARYSLGMLHLRSGDAGRARDEFLAAVESDPDFTDALVKLGRLAVADRRGQDATLYFRRALDLCPGAADWHVGLGIAFALQGDRQAAGQAFRAALNADPAHPIAQVGALFARYYVAGEDEAALKAMKDLREREKSKATLPPETAAYLQTLIRLIEENRGKVQWLDDFEKPDTEQIARSWEQRLGTGPLLRIHAGRAMIEGPQRKSGETVLERSAPAEKFVRFEADVRAKLISRFSAGIQVLHRGTKGGDVQAGLRLGKDASGQLVLWEWEPGGGRWKEAAKYGAWPEAEDEPNRLALELVKDPDATGSQETFTVRAFLNGERFRRRPRGGDAWAGVFAEAEMGVQVKVEADNVRLVLLKK
ncbi:MAG: tetratricopeptide repeat protein [Planctomycetes bacterium]|nr:tetratricopeptide repeat protein [Planctomycetota bacterium]